MLSSKNIKKLVSFNFVLYGNPCEDNCFDTFVASVANTGGFSIKPSKLKHITANFR